MKKPNRFLLAVHPARALVESWVIGLLSLFLLSLQAGIVSHYVLGNGILFLCGTCGMWAVLRIRLPQGKWLRQAVWEVAIGLALSLVMAVGLRVPAQVLGWQKVWQGANLGGSLETTLLLLAIGPGYVLARGGVRIWLLWNRMRRQRMLWAITHALLTLVVLMALLGVLVIFATSTLTSPQVLLQPEASNVLTSVVDRLLSTLFPAMAIIAVMTAMTLVVLLPPAALFSYWVAHKTTRRLETLADTAGALREGKYQARVDVVGEDEVAQLQAAFNTMANDLERTMHDLEVERDAVARLLQVRRDLVANVSHDLRTPVATIRATLESALERNDQSLPQSLEHDLRVANNEVLRLQGLIDDLFALSQVEAGGLALDCQSVDIVPIVERMVESLAPPAWSTGRVEVIAELPKASSLACVDPARLKQILANLLRNGIRHTPPGGIVAVVTQDEPDTIVVEVRDTGEGIPTTELPHIWERFYRGQNTSQQDSTGAGLGLALVKELTEAMGGSVAVVSRVGEGSSFTVRLPRAQPQAQS